MARLVKNIPEEEKKCWRCGNLQLRLHENPPDRHPWYCTWRNGFAKKGVGVPVALRPVGGGCKGFNPVIDIDDKKGPLGIERDEKGEIHLRSVREIYEKEDAKAKI